MDLMLLTKMPEITRGVSFTVFGDTNHDSPGIRGTFSSPEFMQSLRMSGIRHLCIEFPKEFQNEINDFQLGRISREGFKDRIWNKLDQAGIFPLSERYAPDSFETRLDRMTDQIDSARAYGIHVSAVDSLDYYRDADLQSLEQRVSHDTMVAAHIKESARGEKTAVVYGHGHSGIAATLGPDTRTISVYDRQSWQINVENNRAAIGVAVKPSQIATFLEEGRSYYTAPVPVEVDAKLGLSYMQPITDPDTRTNLMWNAFEQESPSMWNVKTPAKSSLGDLGKPSFHRPQATNQGETPPSGRRR